MFDTGIELAKKEKTEIEKWITQTSFGIYFLSVSIGPFLFKSHNFYLCNQGMR